MRITGFIVSLMALLMVATPVFAKSCYSSKEAEAEQGIRIHSELMVIGLNCQHMTPRGWTNFYQQYRTITNTHKSLIGNYEKTLIGFYSRNGSGKGAERKIHDMRTNFSNKTSADAARMRPDVFCATYAPRIPKVARMSRTEFQQWVSSSATTERLSKPICH